ncbi:MAG: CoA activase [Candidatus Stahlbacteria bacterium]|nr:CoA activase [Candidatus Stahlbacteria bacterium]
MISCGIDGGARNTKVVILKDGKIIGKGMALTGFEQKVAAEAAINVAISEAGIKREDIEYIVATGEGQKEIEFANDTITVVGADTIAVNTLFPQVRTVIDIGAEEGRAIKCDEKGKVIDFAINEKCAAGAGTFCETMARTLEVKIEEMGAISLKSTKSIPMNAQCAVFAESEVVSLIHAKTPKEDIANAVHSAISDRIASMARRVGIEKEVALVGGVAKNIGFVEALKKDLEVEFLIPDDPLFITAYGAAISAIDKVSS